MLGHGITLLCYTTDAVVSLERSENLIVNENSQLSVTITMNAIATQDVIVEVTVKADLAEGTYCVPFNARNSYYFTSYIQLGWIIM